MARQNTIHLVAAVPRKRVPLRAGSVHLYSRNCLGHSGIDSDGETYETVTQINDLTVDLTPRPRSEDTLA